MTIHHVVMWRLNGDTVEEKRANAQLVRDALLPLVGRLPQIKEFSLHDTVVDNERNADLILVSQFDSVEDLMAYQVHPEHEAAAAAIRDVATSRLVGDWAV